ncbi:hypothetical protein JMJ77_0000822 [Colletotrichum scovillei]|uniref:Uncharacterized protein n=1 Tax=Colletotrichum scovillei TaxID=1209932 RepID=A0A9P7UKE7_9PEZI|nr:hypothetical protein JMJ77_0000822 [Colletotrichum scovillei]KAG7072036.1 hypothetical protein JMJ76_0004898 [Colletotrichum scovillei]KAG7080213.1 hypothetical protein JMJ78_0007313 [Colletotrichum scovillei]
MADNQPDAKTPPTSLGGQTGVGTGTPNTLSEATRAQTTPTPSIKATPSSSLPARASSSSSAPIRQNTPTLSQTPSQTPTPSAPPPPPPPPPPPSSSARPLTTFIISTTTNATSTPTPSLSDPPPLPSPTSIPGVIPISTPGAGDQIPTPTPSFIPPPPASVIPETTPLLSLIPTPTPTPTPSGNVNSGSGGIASPSQAETSGGSNVKLMPALPIALGSVGGVLIFGLVIGMLYRKGRWPFRSKRNFAQIDELEVERQQELERQNKMKWDPRVTRTYRTQDAGVNF